MCFYLPPVVHTTPQDLTDQRIDCPSFQNMLHRCSELCNLISTVVMNADDRKKSQMSPEDSRQLQVRSNRFIPSHLQMG